MKKIELSEGILQYLFDPVDHTLYGNNVIAILNDDKAMMIDTGFAFQTEEVINDLKEAGITICSVIISHFHEDHMQGLKRLKDIDVYGSGYYQQTLNQWLSTEEQLGYAPTIKVDKNLKIIFGDHTLELIHNPGHTICTLFVKLDEKYLYVADELMYSENGEPLLPCITKNDIINHYVSVHNLTMLSNYIFIPGHGDILTEPHKIITDVKNVCHYLCEILSHDEELTVEQATKNCTCTYLHTEWHENIYK